MNGDNSGDGSESVKLTLIILGFCAALNPIASHSIVPMLPTLQADFGISYATIQLSISLYLAFLAMGQIVMGVLSDRFGQRRMLLAGLCVFVASSLALAVTTSAVLLLALRALQGASACVGMVTARGVVGNLRGPRMVSRNSNMIAAVSFVAVAAPFFGGAVGETFGWRSLFAVMGGAGVGALALAGVAFRKGLPGDKRKPDSDKIRLSRAAAHLVRSRTFLLNTAMMALALGSIYFFLGAAPYISTALLDFSPSETGAWLLVVSLGLPAGALISSAVGPKLGMRRAMLTGSGLMTVALAAQTALSAGFLDPFTVFLPMCLHCIGMTLLLANAQSAAAVAVPGLTGSAVGLSGAVQFGGASLLAFFGAWMIEYSHWPFVVFLTNAFFCLAISLLTLFRDAQVQTER